MGAANQGLGEIIVVRSLAESDLGLFASHRAAATSKQRAININGRIARRMLSPELFLAGGADLDCTCLFQGHITVERRRLGKTGKNWRLGGNQIRGDVYANLDAKDFALIRSISGNDGTQPLTVSFICRSLDRVTHAGLVAIATKFLFQSMAVYETGSADFIALEQYCRVSAG